jgi:hypothetical protein
MEAVDYFYTCAEIGIALAGFAALVVALGRQVYDEQSPFIQWYVGVLVERGIAAAIFALLPILLLGLGLSDRMTWLLCSGSFAAYVFSMAWRSIRVRRSVPAEVAESLSSGGFAFLLAVGLGVAVLQVFHASGFFFEQSPWWFALAITWLLISLGYMFLIFLRSTLRAS